MKLSPEQTAYRAAVAVCDAHAAKRGSYNPDGTPNVEFINESFRLSKIAFDALDALIPQYIAAGLPT
jgi:hypothetical protein